MEVCGVDFCIAFWTYYTWWLLLLGLELTACIQFPPEDQYSLLEDSFGSPPLLMGHAWDRDTLARKGRFRSTRFQALGLNHA
ncbi:MAG: hypothetical protein H6751_02505 [Candidatus Omnitrophica bacterium]|nr:hypothetical protein [Candidatus Omnitrophota bacterium]